MAPLPSVFFQPLPIGAIALGIGIACGPAPTPEPVRVAVAGNFAPSARVLADRFTARTGTTVEISVGSTGQLFAQIRNGAPFHVFLAADTARPERLEREGHGVAGSRFTYALGTLVVYRPDGTTDGRRTLTSLPATVAIANPRTAPYGAAAVEALTTWGLWPQLEPDIVRGENVAQTFQFVRTGAAEVGLVALSQMAAIDRSAYVAVPESLYAPIRQDALLLVERAEARGFLDFMRTDEARAIIRQYGYAVP